MQQETTPAEPPPTELLIKPPQLEGRRLDMPYKYTRRTSYTKNISDFIVLEQELSTD